MKQDDTLVVNDKQAMNALKKHGGNIIWAIVLVLAGFFGWQYYQKNHAKVDTVAADGYTVIAERQTVAKDWLFMIALTDINF